MARAVLCGSLNLATRDDVFRTVSSIAGASVKRIPDGETGERQAWTDSQIPRFAANPELERADDSAVTGLPSFRLRPGADADALHFEFDYVAAALDSYRAFAELKQEGVIPNTTRFQVSLPTPVAMGMYVDPADIEAILPALERSLVDQVRDITGGIPHDQLAIQFDLAAEMAVVEGVMPIGPVTDLSTVADAAARLAEAVPGDVEVGFHLCYGDEPDAGGEGQHFMQPADTSKLVALANALSRSLGRPIGWIQMPVPIERDDEAYFAPLADLDLPAETELYLGLVHKEDGVEGAQRRVAAAAQYVDDFGVATECGMGREPREAVPELLRIQAEVKTR